MFLFQIPIHKVMSNNTQGIAFEEHIREDRLRLLTDLFTVGVQLIPSVQKSICFSFTPRVHVKNFFE